MSPVETKYRMSFTTGGLLINESVEIARLHKPGEAWADTVVRALSEGATLLPKAKSNRRTVREISNRLVTLSAEELAFLAGESGRQEQQALLWLAVCRAYRIVREFSVEVIRERHLSYRFDLSHEAFDQFFDAKAEWDDFLASISGSTRERSRQVLFKMMREASIISESNQIQTAYLSPKVERLIRESGAGDLAVFPGVSLEGIEF